MTGSVAERLIAGMRQPVRPGALKLRNFVQGRPQARKLMAEVSSIEALVAKGMDPLHAAYTNAQNYLSVFSEVASGLRELGSFTAAVEKATEDYAPAWPPMSPVSVSFFTCWALLDLPVSKAGETICSCATEIGRAFDVSADFTAVLEAMGESAMGIYQHLGWRGGTVGLRDILDDREYRCIVPSGHRGAKGELWYARLFPPHDDGASYHVAFTSPYVLRGSKEADWRAFFERQQQRSLPPLPTSGEKALRRRALLKRGPTTNFWNEFVFLGYHGASNNAIELCGMPDLPATLPHASLARR